MTRMILSVDILQALRTRRSVPRLTGPAPSEEEICGLITDAAGGPDHGLVRPWRLVLVSGEARNKLGTAFAEQLNADDPHARSRAAAKPLRAPLLVSIIFVPQQVPNVPRWEQLAATVCLVSNLMLLLHAQGWGTMWRTGVPCTSATVQGILGVGHEEQLLGWLYVGTPVPGSKPPRPEYDWREHVSILDHNGKVTPLKDR